MQIYCATLRYTNYTTVLQHTTLITSNYATLHQLHHNYNNNHYHNYNFNYTTLHYTNYTAAHYNYKYTCNNNYNLTTLHNTTLHWLQCITLQQQLQLQLQLQPQLQLPLHYTTLHYITLHYTTLHYITLHYTTLHYAYYTTLHYATLHYTNYTAIHYNDNYNYNCTTPHYIQQLWEGDHCNRCNHFKKTQLQPPVGPSVDSLCHPWFTTTNLSYRFPIFETSATALCGTTGNWDTNWEIDLVGVGPLPQMPYICPEGLRGWTTIPAVKLRESQRFQRDLGWWVSIQL